MEQQASVDDGATAAPGTDAGALGPEGPAPAPGVDGTAAMAVMEYSETKPTIHDGSLADAIALGKIEVPDLMTWYEWQNWRAGPGARPKLKNDGFGRTATQEAALWHQIMESQYGPDFKARRAARDDARSSRRSCRNQQSGNETISY